MLFNDIMPIEVVKMFTPSLLKSRSDDIFVFGDNMERRGKGGQAAVCRDKPNAVGIPTKWGPRRDEDAYFTDDDFARVKDTITQDFLKLVEHARNGGTVIFPEDGIGTGRAELDTRAPRIYRYIQACTERLKEIDIEHNPNPQSATL